MGASWSDAGWTSIDGGPVDKDTNVAASQGLGVARLERQSGEGIFAGIIDKTLKRLGL